MKVKVRVFFACLVIAGMIVLGVEAMTEELQENLTLELQTPKPEPGVVKLPQPQVAEMPQIIDIPAGVVERVVKACLLPSGVVADVHTYMYAQAITSQGSLQLEFRQHYWPNSRGLMKYHNGKGVYDFVIALPQAYASEVGQRFRITFSSGYVHTFVVGDLKATEHTNSTQQYREAAGDRVNIVEFIVCKNTIDEELRQLGNVGELYEEFSGSVIKIERLEDSQWLRLRQNDGYA